MRCIREKDERRGEFAAPPARRKQARPLGGRRVRPAAKPETKNRHLQTRTAAQFSLQLTRGAPRLGHSLKPKKPAPVSKLPGRFLRFYPVLVFLHIKPEHYHIAVLHDVFFAFHADEAFFSGGGLGFVFKKVFPVDDFGFDEAPLEVGVDLAGSLGSFGSPGDGPGAGFFLTGGEEAHEV